MQDITKSHIPFKVQEKPMDINVSEYKNFIDMVQISHCIYPLRNYHLFWLNIKEKHPQLSEKTIKTFVPFPTTYLYKVKFSSYISTKHILQQITCRKRCENVSSIQLDIKRFTKM